MKVPRDHGAGLDGDAKSLARIGQPLAPISEKPGRSPEPAAGKLMRHWDDALDAWTFAARR